MVAKSKGVKQTVALVENIDYFELSHSIGIDTIINKKLLAANSIFRYIRRGEVVAMTKLSNMDAELLEFIVKPSSKIVDMLIKEGLPQELSWLPLVESGFIVKALSKQRALGLWQFIPSSSRATLSGGVNDSLLFIPCKLKGCGTAKVLRLCTSC